MNTQIHILGPFQSQIKLQIELACRFVVLVDHLLNTISSASIPLYNF